MQDTWLDASEKSCLVKFCKVLREAAKQFFTKHLRTAVSEKDISKFQLTEIYTTMTVEGN